MRTDLYTKVVLTVIAIALIIIVVQNTQVVPTAHAQGNNYQRVTDVNIVSVNGSRLSTSGDGSLNVSFSRPQTVELKTPYGGVDVNVRNYRDFK